MRISDWSSDVCSSDLDDGHPSVREVEPPMAETGNIDTLEHNHVFLGASHDENARRTLWVVALTAVMMVGEIIAGYVTGSMALLAAGFQARKGVVEGKGGSGSVDLGGTREIKKKN